MYSRLRFLPQLLLTFVARREREGKREELGEEREREKRGTKGKRVGKLISEERVCVYEERREPKDDDQRRE